MSDTSICQYYREKEYFHEYVPMKCYKYVYDVEGIFPIKNNCEIFVLIYSPIEDAFLFFNKIEYGKKPITIYTALSCSLYVNESADDMYSLLDMCIKKYTMQEIIFKNNFTFVAYATHDWETFYMIAMCNNKNIKNIQRILLISKTSIKYNYVVEPEDMYGVPFVGIKPAGYVNIVDHVIEFLKAYNYIIDGVDIQNVIYEMYKNFYNNISDYKLNFDMLESKNLHEKMNNVVDFINNKLQKRSLDKIIQFYELAIIIIYEINKKIPKNENIKVIEFIKKHLNTCKLHYTFKHLNRGRDVDMKNPDDKFHIDGTIHRMIQFIQRFVICDPIFGTFKLDNVDDVIINEYSYKKNVFSKDDEKDQAKRLCHSLLTISLNLF